MSKQAMRDETERLVKEALERKTVTIKQGQTLHRGQMRKVRSAKSRFGRSGTVSGAIYMQGMRREAKDVVTADPITGIEDHWEFRAGRAIL